LTVGGFSRRLRDSFPEDDHRHQTANIIVNEVARIESFLTILFASIRPFELCLAEVDINELLYLWLNNLEEHLQSKGMTWKTDLPPDLPHIRADEDRISQVFENIFKHAVGSMPEGGHLDISTNQDHDHLVIVFKYQISYISDEDVEQYFYPHIDAGTNWTALDMPLVKIIIHRHGGKVDVFKETADVLVVRIELPLT
ncbi:MAG: hypothetical protein HQK58_16600, partial [Deltaproteobacteria bacterium]|nr:hypothetical protein [Deltaproteobacteria bacterium]